MRPESGNTRETPDLSTATTKRRNYEERQIRQRRDRDAFTESARAAAIMRSASLEAGGGGTLKNNAPNESWGLEASGGGKGGFGLPDFLRRALLICMFFLSLARGEERFPPPLVSRSLGGSSSTPNWTLGVLAFSSVASASKSTPRKRCFGVPRRLDFYAGVRAAIA